MNRLNRYIFFLSVMISVFNHPCLTAQTTGRGAVSGFVVDSDTRAPLPYTNVFLANTTLGDAADDRGEFIIENIPPGAFQLVVSRIGYEIFVRDLIIQPEKTIALNATLTVASIVGEEISIVGERDTRQWRRDLVEFKRYFIGETRNAEKCTIRNPEVLTFSREPLTNNLLAKSDRSLIIENRALGYRIDVILDNFRWGFGGGYFLIYPHFSALTPADNR